MKTITKVILAISAVIVWIVCMFVFVPYDLKTVEISDDAPLNFFSIESNYMIDEIFAERFEDADTILSSLAQSEYKCLTAEESYDLLMKNGDDLINGYPVTDRLMGVACYIDGQRVSQLVFFESEEKNYVLFTLSDDEKDRFRLLPVSYAIFEADDFSDELTQNFVTSQRMISKPASNSAIEAMIQSGIVTAVYVIIYLVIALSVSTAMYKKMKKNNKLSDDEITTDNDIKKYIKNKLGAEFFDDELITVQPCITVDAKGEKAKTFIADVAEKFNVNEIFIGNFFENRSFLDNESDNAVFIREYLDENSYSSINHKQNEAVIGWIIDGNNAEETAISFYMQELNILIYPAREKLYIFSKNSRKTYDKIITAVNPSDYMIQF